MNSIFSRYNRTKPAPARYKDKITKPPKSRSIKLSYNYKEK